MAQQTEHVQQNVESGPSPVDGRQGAYTKTHNTTGGCSRVDHPSYSLSPVETLIDTDLTLNTAHHQSVTFRD